MRRRMGLIVAAVAVLGLVAGGVAFASAGGSAKQAGAGAWGRGFASPAEAGAEATPAPQISTAVTLDLQGREVNGDFVDVGRPGESVGDAFLFRQELFRRGTNQRVGSLFVTCTLHFGTTPCEGTAVIFGRGKIEVASAIYDEPVFTVAVTGGTGDFQNARGQAVVREPNRITFHLIP
jgi:hypothetical protein